MAKLTLTDVTSGYALTTTLNANNALIEAALENTLSRDGTSPNTMSAALDMNSYNINNLPDATQNQQPVTLAQAASLAGVTNPLTRETVGAVFYPQTSAETTAGVTPTNYYYPAGNVLRYGADNTGGTDAATAFNNCIASNDSMYIPDGTYIVDSQITVDKTFHIEFGNVTIDASAATGSFPQAVLYFDGGDATALPDLSTDYSKGEDTLVLASSPTISENDVFFIYNPTAGSFYAVNNAYTAGEFCKVYSVSGATVNIYGFLWDSYTAAAVDLYKLAGRRFTASGGDLHVIAPNTATVNAEDAIKFRRGVGCRVSNIRGSNSGDKGIGIDQCYDFLGVNLSATQNDDASFGTDYGLSISNSQKVNITGNFWGRRHASTVGGSSGVGAVPCRDLHIKGTFENGPEAAAGVNAADTHGNCEFVRYEGVFIGGIKCSGGSTSWKGLVKQNDTRNGIAIYCTNWWNTNHDFEGLVIEAVGDPMDASSRGVIDIGGSQNTITADTTEGGLINMRNITFRCPDAERLVQIRNRGMTGITEPVIIDLSGIKVLQSDTLGTAGFRIDAFSGDAFDVMYCKDVYANGMPWSVANVDVIFGGAELQAKQTWNPGSIANGAEEAVDVTVTGAQLGDFVTCSLGVDLADLVLSASVTAPNTVTAVLANNTGGAVDLTSSALRIVVHQNFGY